MIRLNILLLILTYGIDVYAQEFSFLPEGLQPVPLTELQKPEHPLDYVYTENGIPLDFREAMQRVQNETAIPMMFVDKHGDYKALIIKEKIEIDYPNFPEHLKSMGYSFGDPNSDTIILFSQGGPSTVLSTWKWQKSLLEKFTGFENYFFANIHQWQTLNSEGYDEKEFSFENAKTYVDFSTSIITELVNYFKSLNKKVFLYGISGGAFLITDFIATEGNIADGYLIMVGRLNMNEEMWKPRTMGMRAHFQKDGKTVVKVNEEITTRGKNNDKIKAAYAYKRSTDLLLEKDLSNLIYFYGKTDANVGALNKQEIEFLNSHGALVLASNGDHTSYDEYLEICLRLMLLD